MLNPFNISKKRIRHFATPRANNSFYCRVLTERCRRDLGTQVHFMKNIRLTDEARAGIMNPSFLEFLMGYPKGWTRLSVRKDSES
jgi:hypothetical protein